MTETDTPIPQFLESEIPKRDKADCLFQVIPAPIEQTVSYGAGTANGPQAIIDASYQLEAFDGRSCPCNNGIFTHPPQYNLKQLEAYVSGTIQNNHVPVILGGEHSVTYPVVKALKEKIEPFGVIQFDAHADLRDSYEGSKFSHACVMRRIFEQEIPIFQIGVRALSKSEYDFRLQENIPYLDAEELALKGIPLDLLPKDFPKQVYISFDIDALDSSIIPATGTPEPGGLYWWQTMQLLENIAKHHDIIGFDVVELAPIKKHHASDFATARLVYNIMGYISRQRGM